MAERALVMRFAAGLLTAIVITLWIGLWIHPAVGEIRTTQGVLRQDLQRLSRYQSLLRNEAEITRGADHAQLASRPTYKGTTESSLMAAFQRDVAQIASDAGVPITSITPTSSDARLHGFSHLTLNVEIRGDTLQLRNFLVSMAESSPYIGVQSARIRATDQGTTTRAAQLSMYFVLVAFGEADGS